MRPVPVLLLSFFLMAHGLLPQAAAQGASCDARTFGAKPDGTTLNTASLQAAIDSCSKRGVPVRLTGPGVYVSGPLSLKTGTTLDLAADATLEASTNHDDFKLIQEFHAEGREPLLSSDHAENITITGGGTIDGRGESWWPMRDKDDRRPRLIVFRYSKHIRMENVTVQNSPSWQIVPYYSDDLVFRNMKVLAPEGKSHNTDGIDPFSSGYVTIDHVLIDTGDDNVAIKSGQPGSAGGDAPSHDIIITDCTFLHGHGLSVGSDIAGGVNNVRVERVHFKSTGTGIRIKSNRDRGNDIGGFVYRGLVMEDVAVPISISAYYPKIPTTIETAPVTRLTPHFHDITIENVTATGARQAAVFIGLPEAPIRRLTLTNVHIQAAKPGAASYVDVLSKDVTFTVPGPTPMVIGDGVRGNLQ